MNARRERSPSPSSLSANHLVTTCQASCERHPSCAATSATGRPEAYLDENVRRGISVWATVGPDAERRAVHSLRNDLASGRWAERNRDLVDLDAAELGARLLIA